MIAAQPTERRVRDHFLAFCLHGFASERMDRFCHQTRPTKTAKTNHYPLSTDHYFTGLTFQISSQYSRMERSEEK